MYAALWRHLPGPWPIRVLLLAVLLAVLMWVCFTWAFPWISGLLPLDDAAVNGALSTDITVAAA